MNRYQRSQEARQAIRSRIARQRRRLDRQLDLVMDGVMLVGSPRRFVQQHPARSLLGAAGLGILLARLLSRRDSVSDIVNQLRDWFGAESLTRFWRDLRELFRFESKPGSTGAEDEQDG